MKARSSAASTHRRPLLHRWVRAVTATTTALGLAAYALAGLTNGLGLTNPLATLPASVGSAAIAALVIGYFGINAYSGNRGLRAKQDLDQQIAELSAELDALKVERAMWERHVSLLKPESIDPDMLDERARVLLNYADPRELTLRLKQP